MSRTRTGDQALIREINLSIVLYALREHGVMSRAALAAHTGLTKVTVSALALQLIARGLVVERGIGKNGLGRSGILLELNPQGGAMIGVEIGVDFVSILLTNFSADTLWRHQEQTVPGSPQTKVLDCVSANLQTAVKIAKKQKLEIFGCTIGLPGLVDVEAGTLLYAPNLKWSNVPVRDLLQDRFIFPIYVDNEASIGAFGEKFFGVARGKLNMVYVYAAVGIGGGLVTNGQIVPGATGFAGEIGHVTIEPNGPLCNCGNRGCWETLASQAAVVRRVEQAIAGGQSSSLTRYFGKNSEPLTVPAIVQAADQGDDVARQALTETGVYFGIGIANLINTLNPEIVVVGGILSLAKDYLLPVIEQTIAQRALPWSRQATQIVIAANGADNCLVGGVALVYDHVLRHPLHTHHKRNIHKPSPQIIPRQIQTGFGAGTYQRRS